MVSPLLSKTTYSIIIIRIVTMSHIRWLIMSHKLYWVKVCRHQLEGKRHLVFFFNSSCMNETSDHCRPYTMQEFMCELSEDIRNASLCSVVNGYIFCIICWDILFTFSASHCHPCTKWRTSTTQYYIMTSYNDIIHYHVYMMRFPLLLFHRAVVQFAI